MMDGGWMWGHGWGWAGWLMMCVVMLLFWAGLITATVAGIRYLGADRAPYARRSSTVGPEDLRPSTVGPEDLLAHRYARGDIDDDEYRRRLATLREHRVAS